MASLDSSPLALGFHREMNIIQLLDANVPQIAIDLKTGDFIFTTPVMIKAAAVGFRNILIGVVGGMLIGGAFGAVAGGGNVICTALACKDPIAAGAGAGIVGGGVVAGTYTVLKGSIRIHEINREVSQIKINANVIMNRLFRTLVEGEVEQGVQFYCPISNQLMHIPVSTGCNAERNDRGVVMIDPDGNIMRRSDEVHIFDYNALRVHLKSSNRCPHPGCEELVKPEEIFFEQQVRIRISQVVNSALRWLNLQDAVYRDYSEIGPDFLADVDEVCDRLDEGTHTRDDLSLLSYLTQESVEKYNDNVLQLYYQLSDIVKNKKNVRSSEKIKCNEMISKLTKSYKIELTNPRVDK